jgi:hypothetical protein
VSYRKYPPDLDGFGIFIVCLVVALVVIAVVRLT